MTKLPAKELPDGTKEPQTTTGEFRLAMGNLRQFLFDLLGDESADKETAGEHWESMCGPYKTRLKAAPTAKK